MFLDSRHPPLSITPVINDETSMSLEPRQLARNTTAIVLAGGKGTRLGALTRSECKPALPFGGLFRNIDFSLSNCVNSGIYRIGVATQYQDASLVQHLGRTWLHPGENGEGFVEPWRAELQTGAGSYRGTADAVFQNWSRIEALDARLVLILAGDHVYKMDYRPMLMRHISLGADVTVGCVEIPIESAREFGVMSIDGTDRITRFMEKPQHPECLPGQPGRTLGSMGIYVFNRELLGRLLRDDALSQVSSHDFGHDLLPRLIDQAMVFAYPFTRNAFIGAGYWRDVGTITAYWRAHMEILDGIPGFSLDDANWPVRSKEPALDLFHFTGKNPGISNTIVNSLVARDCNADHARVHHSVLFTKVSVKTGSELSNAVVLPYAEIGCNCSLHDVVIGAGTRVPDGTIVERGRLHDGAGRPAPSLVVGETAFTPGVELPQRQANDPFVRGDAIAQH